MTEEMGMSEPQQTPPADDKRCEGIDSPTAFSKGPEVVIETPQPTPAPAA